MGSTSDGACYIIEQVGEEQGWAACTEYLGPPCPLQARHLYATFGQRAITTWARHRRDLGGSLCNDGLDADGSECICILVDEGITWYGDDADAIADTLLAVGGMVDDEACESDC